MNNIKSRLNVSGESGLVRAKEEDVSKGLRTRAMGQYALGTGMEGLGKGLNNIGDALNKVGKEVKQVQEASGNALTKSQVDKDGEEMRKDYENLQTENGISVNLEANKQRVAEFNSKWEEILNNGDRDYTPDALHYLEKKLANHTNNGNISATRTSAYAQSALAKKISEDDMDIAVVENDRDRVDYLIQSNVGNGIYTPEMATYESVRLNSAITTNVTKIGMDNIEIPANIEEAKDERNTIDSLFKQIDMWKDEALTETLTDSDIIQVNNMALTRKDALIKTTQSRGKDVISKIKQGRITDGETLYASMPEGDDKALVGVTMGFEKRKYLESQQNGKITSKLKSLYTGISKGDVSIETIRNSKLSPSELKTAIGLYNGNTADDMVDMKKRTGFFSYIATRNNKSVVVSMKFKTNQDKITYATSLVNQIELSEGKFKINVGKGIKGLTKSKSLKGSNTYTGSDALDLVNEMIMSLGDTPESQSLTLRMLDVMSSEGNLTNINGMINKTVDQAEEDYYIKNGLGEYPTGMVDDIYELNDLNALYTIYKTSYNNGNGVLNDEEKTTVKRIVDSGKARQAKNKLDYAMYGSTQRGVTTTEVTTTEVTPTEVTPTVIKKKMSTDINNF